MKTKAYLALFLMVIPGLASAEPRRQSHGSGVLVSDQRLFENQPARPVVSHLSGSSSYTRSGFEPAELRFQQYERALPPNQRRALSQMGPDDMYRERQQRVNQDDLSPLLREAPRQAPARSTERTRQRQYQRGATGAPYVSANAVNARQDMSFFPGGEDGEDAPWDPLLLILLILSLGLFLCLISVLQRLRDKIFDEY
jgi:hypothetical protein